MYRGVLLSMYKRTSRVQETRQGFPSVSLHDVCNNYYQQLLMTIFSFDSLKLKKKKTMTFFKYIMVANVKGQYISALVIHSYSYSLVDQT
jgi:hypothetical protein